MIHEHAPETHHFPRFDLLKLTPEKPISPIPVLVAPGFGSNAESYQLLMEVLSVRGFIAMCPNYEYGMRGEPRKFLVLPDVDKAKQQVLLAAIQAEGYPNEQGVKQVNVVAHSKGAFDVASVAIEHPEHFRNIIMVAPGNLRPKMSILQGIRTLSRSDHRDKEDKARLVAEGGDVARRVLANNAYGASYKSDRMRYLVEGFTSATKSMQDFIPELRRRGVRVMIVAQTDDAFYSPESFGFIRDSIDGFVQVPGIHGEIKFRPDVSQRVSDLLQSLEAA